MPLFVSQSRQGGKRGEVTRATHYSVAQATGRRRRVMGPVIDPKTRPNGRRLLPNGRRDILRPLSLSISTQSSPLPRPLLRAHCP